VHRLGLRLLGAKVWKKLLIIEPFSQSKLKIKSKPKTALEFEGNNILGVVEKPSASQSDLIELISQFSELKV